MTVPFRNVSPAREFAHSPFNDEVFGSRSCYFALIFTGDNGMVIWSDVAPINATMETLKSRVVRGQGVRRRCGGVYCPGREAPSERRV